MDTYGSYQCKCEEGYRLLSWQNVCVDQNECLENPNICDQTCENFDGGYRCTCFKGYMQDWKTKKCICKCLNNTVYSTNDFTKPYILNGILNLLFKSDKFQVVHC